MARACLGGLGGGAPLGGHSPGLRLAAAVCRPGKSTQSNLRSLLRQDPRASALPMCLPWVPALTPAPSDWAAPRQDGTHKLQRPAARRPGERRARFYPTPSSDTEAMGSPATPAGRCSTRPSEKCLGRGLLFLFCKPNTPWRCGLSHIVADSRQIMWRKFL